MPPERDRAGASEWRATRKRRAVWAVTCTAWTLATSFCARLSPTVVGDESAQCVRRGHEVVRARHWLRVAGKCVAAALAEPRHAGEHVGEPLLVGAEADEHRAVLRNRSVRHVPAE